MPLPEQIKQTLNTNIVLLLSNMVTTSLPASFCIHTKDFAAKTVAGLQPQLKGSETS